MDNYEHIESGKKLIEAMLKSIKKPVDDAALKTLKESMKLLAKKVKMMQKDESLELQYLDRVKFDVIQGVFQALHLYILSSDSNDDVIGETVTWLREHENIYELAQKLQARAEARAEFSGAK